MALVKIARHFGLSWTFLSGCFSRYVDIGHLVSTVLSSGTSKTSGTNFKDDNRCLSKVSFVQHSRFKWGELERHALANTSRVFFPYASFALGLHLAVTELAQSRLGW